MTKTEYMNTINEKLTAAEGLCADLRKLRGLKKLAQSITGSDALVSFEALGKTIADKEAELKTVRGELQKARRIVKKLDEIEAIEAGTAPAPRPRSRPRRSSRPRSPPRQSPSRPPRSPRPPPPRRPEKGVPDNDLSENLDVRPGRNPGEDRRVSRNAGKGPEGAGAHAGAKTLARKCQEMIDGLEVDMATIDELQEIHDRE